MQETLRFSFIHKQRKYLTIKNLMGTCKPVPQIRRSGTLHGTKSILIAKFRGLAAQLKKTTENILHALYLKILQKKMY